MDEDYKVTLCLSGEERTEEEHLRDKLEVLKAEIHNLLRENEQMYRDLNFAIEDNCICELCGEQETGCKPRYVVDTLFCPDGAEPKWNGIIDPEL